LSPLDADTIIASVKKTTRCVTAHEAVVPGGFGAELAAVVQYGAFDYLDCTGRTRRRSVRTARVRARAGELRRAACRGRARRHPPHRRPGMKVPRQAMQSRFLARDERRQPLSSVAPILSSIDAPCVLGWLAPRARGTRQHHLTGHCDGDRVKLGRGSGRGWSPAPSSAGESEGDAVKKREPLYELDTDR